MPVAQTVAEYIAQFPPDVRKRLKDLRKVAREAAPKAEETIKYGMPTYVQNGNLISFGAYKKHIGFYPTVAEFKEEQAPYKAERSTLQFPYDQPLPLALIKKIVKARVKDLANKASRSGRAR